MDAPQPDLTIVVPVYNEVESLPELYAEIVAALDPSPYSFEILCIDDGSTDGSYDCIRELHEKDPRVRAVRFRGNFGKSPALAAAFRNVRGRFVATIDADLQDDPLEIPKMLGKLEEGYDLVCAWRTTRRDRFVKWTTSLLFNSVTTWVTGVHIHDFNCGLKAYRREVVDTIHVYGQMHRYIPALAQNAGFKVTELPVEHRPRVHGVTKFGPGRFTAGMFDLLTAAFLQKFNRRPLHFFGLVGAIFGMLGMGILVWLTCERLFAGELLKDRPLLLLGVLLLIVAVQFISIGLLGEMIVDSQKDRFQYAVRETLP